MLPPREIEGADDVQPGIVLEMSSGNYCRMWPAATYDSEKNETRYAFFMEWYTPATPEDVAEITATTDAMMGGKPVVLTEGPIDSPENAAWLRDGKAPKPRRTN